MTANLKNSMTWGRSPNAIKLRALHVGLPLQTVMSCRGNPLWLPSPKSGTIWHWGRSPRLY